MRASVIAGKSGGAPDAVIEGVTGLTVDGTQVSDVVRAVNTMLADPEKSRAMGESGRKWIHDKWRWDIWAAEFNALFK